MALCRRRWLDACAHLGRAAPRRDHGAPGAVASAGGGCSERCEHPALPAPVTQIPPGDGPKATVQLRGWGPPAGEEPVETGWGAGRAALLAGREQAGGGHRGTWVGAGKDWTQTKLFFAMKRKTVPLLPGLYICMFFPLQ